MNLMVKKTFSKYPVLPKNKKSRITPNGLTHFDKKNHKKTVSSCETATF